MIIVEPMGGLANRMRVIASAIALSQSLKAKLTVVWNENDELKCPYSLLFNESGSFVVSQKKKLYNHLKTSHQPSLRESTLVKWRNKLVDIDYCIQDADVYQLITQGQLNLYEAAQQYKTVYIQTCHEFGNNTYAYRYFEPIAAISEKITKIICQYTEATIGIHIRRTDHENAKQYSPTYMFIDRMRQALTTRKDTSFFLCTDDPEVERLMVMEFGSKIYVHKKDYSRLSVSGMQDAVVDLFCLSKTGKILGSYWSSFSEVAAKLNNIPLEVVKAHVSGDHTDKL